MKRNLMFQLKVVISFAVMFWAVFPPVLADSPDVSFAEIEKRVGDLYRGERIPGFSLVVVKGDRHYAKGFGYADLQKKIPVTPGTLFELGSCSKAFTALAAVRLEKEGLIRLDDPVSKYLPWFFVKYRGKKQPITVRQLLHHTSGIPWTTLSDIPRSRDEDALEQTVRNIVGIELVSLPGQQYGYATINYDVVGLIIQEVSGLAFGRYMEKAVFEPLGLDSTSVGKKKEGLVMAGGYKIGFGAPRRYDAPVYRGNEPAGYVISNGRDIADWLQWQLGLKAGDFNELIRKTQRRDTTVPPDRNSLRSYAMGWEVSLNGDGEIVHGGWNPNFTAYVGLRPEAKIGVAVLANSNSNYSYFLGDYVMKLVAGEKNLPTYHSATTFDKNSSIISLFLCIYILGVLAFWVAIAVDVIKGRRGFEPLTLRKLGKLAGTVLILIPFLLGIYLIPWALANFSWESAIVWTPVSFLVVTVLLLAAIGVSVPGYLFSALFPHKNKYKRSLPLLLVFSLLSGGANVVIIFLIAGSIYRGFNFVYLLYYFGLAFFIYILGRKVIETRLIRITLDIIYDLRMKLIEKIFYTSFQSFEKIDRGRVYATLNDDTAQIGNSANTIVQLVTSIITVVGAFIYLAVIAFWATAVTVLVIAAVATLYYIVSKKARVFFEKARDTRNVYMGLLNGLIDGFKELSLRFNRKREYRVDIERSCDEFRSKMGAALIRFLNAFLVGESLLIIVLTAVAFAVPQIFPQVSRFTIMSFIMVLLYLIGPINAILNAIPQVMQLKVSWNRVQQFLRDIPANIDPQKLGRPGVQVEKVVQNIDAKELFFQYQGENEDEKFTVGPLDFEVNKGEIIFVIGGNGSGKTTLAKLLTGLYIPDRGIIKIDGRQIDNYRLGEYFSTVFSDYYLFAKLYDVDLGHNGTSVRKYLEMLHLDGKVEVQDHSFSTINLSGGQRKRLALLQCYLEDSPIYLFDELAADQDPGFRKFFYRELLQKMKERGKIVIAITHDDHYFDVADKIIKLDMGKIDYVDTKPLTPPTRT